MDVYLEFANLLMKYLYNVCMAVNTQVYMYIK